MTSLRVFTESARDVALHAIGGGGGGGATGSTTTGAVVVAVVVVVVYEALSLELDELVAAGTPCPVAQSKFFSRALALFVVIPPA